MSKLSAPVSTLESASEHVGGAISGGHGSSSAAIVIDGSERSSDAPVDSPQSAQHSEITGILLSAEQIQDRVKSLAAQIDKDFEGEIIHMLVVLDGGCIFASDLVRALRGEVMLHFIKASSYGDRTTSAGRVRLKGGIQFEPKGQRVIVVDDIVDTGRTAEALRNRLEWYDPKEICYAALLSKPSRRLVPVEIKYLGFEIPNRFVVGYGMDFAQRFRHLADIHVISEELQEEVE